MFGATCTDAPFGCFCWRLCVEWWLSIRVIKFFGGNEVKIVGRPEKQRRSPDSLTLVQKANESIIKGRQVLSVVLSICVTISTLGLDGCHKTEQAPMAAAPSQAAPAVTYATPTPDELYQLVAPIALFPDNLVAQVLASSTFPDEITAANAWLKQNAALNGNQLMQAADQQPWDASVKAMTQFPDVLGQMASSLSWTSALGDAYFNVPQSVMNAIQVMRQRAQQSGNLKSNQQQVVSVQNQAPAAAQAPASSGAAQTVVVQAPPQTIVIQPAQPTVVYVPTYNPAVVYGAPVPVYPGYSTGAMVATSLLSFGVGIAVGAAISGGGCCGWGWNSWGCGWHNSTVIYNRNVYISNSNTFVNRNNYYNRNNFNNANVNRNNFNNANVNRNNFNNTNYRANNFNNNARPGNPATPQFNQKYNQPQFNNKNVADNRGNLGQANRQQPGAANRGNLNQQNAARPNQPQTRQNINQPQNRQNLNQTQRDPARGYGQQANKGTSGGAFSNYGPGGNARVDSARGQQSLQGNRAAGGGGGTARPQPQSRPQPQRSAQPRASGRHK